MSELLGNVNGADMYLIISLIIFIGVFIMATIYMLVMPKQLIKTISELPLNDDNSYED